MKNKSSQGEKFKERTSDSFLMVNGASIIQRLNFSCCLRMSLNKVYTNLSSILLRSRKEKGCEIRLCWIHSKGCCECTGNGKMKGEVRGRMGVRLLWSTRLRIKSPWDRYQTSNLSIRNRWKEWNGVEKSFNRHFPISIFERWYLCTLYQKCSS